MARTRVLNVDEAIQIASDLFWRNGYERTSLGDLTKAMGVTPPSFYYEFGSKDGLFKRVLDNYFSTRLSWAEEALRESSARGVAEVMLHRLADLFSDPAYPPGCLAVNCSLTYPEDGASSEEMRKLKNARHERLRKRFAAARKSGDLPKDADPDELARYVITVGWGLAHAAKSGATKVQLHRTVERAMKGWPGATPTVCPTSASTEMPMRGMRSSSRQVRDDH
jgi:AcrR family transcriptional regulator